MALPEVTEVDPDEPQGFMVPPGFAEDLKAQIALLHDVPLWLLGEGEPPEPVHVPWWRRLLRWGSDARLWLACWAFCLIAGYKVPDDHE
jgi:hypothetical protein